METVVVDVGQVVVAAAPEDIVDCSSWCCLSLYHGIKVNFEPPAHALNFAQKIPYRYISYTYKNGHIGTKLAQKT